VTGSSRMPAPAPPWRAVIANTLRLWWQRNVRLPGSASASQPLVRTQNSLRQRQESLRRTQESLRRTRALRVIVSLLVVALVVVSAAAIHLAQTQASTAGRAPLASHDSDPSGTSALRAAGQSRQQAAAWIASQVGPSVIVACDPLMCTALQQHGFPAANLTPVSQGAGDPLGSGIVVSTAAVRGALGPRLTSVYAPLVLASFGTRQSLVQVLAAAPDGAAAFQTAAAADLQSRLTAGRQLRHNTNLQLTGAAARQLAAGQVDSRLLITLSALARQPVRVLSFSGDGPGAAPGVPLRAMSIRPSSAADLQGLLAFLHAQRAPLLAVTSVSHAGTGTILHVEFMAPSPTGLLPKT
jgi:hypothetical protein